MRLVVLCLLVCLAFARSPSEWQTRAIYQILTDRFASHSSPSQSCSNLSNYCGGDYQGVIDKLDYIEDLGFNAIWISPIVLNFDNGYHGYWAQNIYQVNPNFGTETDLAQLVTECHKRDIWVLVDVVANHMGCSGCRTFESIYPFNSSEHYHSYCDIVDWSNQQQVENCRLAGLPDLAQENPYVEQTLLNWINQLVAKYNFDGVRIDTGKNVPKSFWLSFTNASGVYCVGEVFDGDLNYVQGYEASMGAVLNYPLFFTLRDVFMSGNSMKEIESNFFQRISTWKNVNLQPVFVDNHDNSRFLYSQKDWQKYKSALTFVLCNTIPIIYYGTEQAYAGGNDPNNRESLWPNYAEQGYLYSHIKTTLALRKSMIAEFAKPYIQRYADDTFYAFSRGLVFAAMTNQGSGATQVRTITYHPYSDGSVLCDIYSGSCLQVTSNQFQVTIQNGQPIVLVPKRQLLRGVME